MSLRETKLRKSNKAFKTQQERGKKRREGLMGGSGVGWGLRGPDESSGGGDCIACLEEERGNFN